MEMEEEEKGTEYNHGGDIGDAETDLNSVFPDVALVEDNTIQIGQIDVDTVQKREKELK